MIHTINQSNKWAVPAALLLVPLLIIYLLHSLNEGSSSIKIIFANEPLQKKIQQFNWKFYVRHNIDLPKAGVLTEKAAVEHFITTGYDEKRPSRPSEVSKLESFEEKSKVFDWKLYIRYNPDLFQLGIKTEKDAMDHYLQEGYMLKRISNKKELTKFDSESFNEKVKKFDWKFYIRCNFDLPEEGVKTKKEALEHFNSKGFKDKRPSNPKEIRTSNESIDDKLKLFDWRLYLRLNPDVFAAGVKTEDDAIQHYIDIGYIERRSSNPLEKKLSGETLDDKLKLFNWRFYVKNNEDLSKAGMKTLKNAVKHYISTGYFEKRPCSPKEPIAAIATADKNKDSIGLPTNTTTVTHAATISLTEKPSKAEVKVMTSKDPLNVKLINFDWRFYLRFNKDVSRAGIKTENEALEHFTKIGFHENRPSNSTEISLPNESLEDKLKLFDWKYYLRSNMDLVQAGIRNKKDAIKHYTESGYIEGRPSNPAEGQAPTESLEDKVKQFDWIFYLKYNPDLSYVGIYTKKQAIQHFIKSGYTEKRWSSPFEIPTSVACIHGKAIIDLNPDFSTYCSDQPKIPIEIDGVSSNSTFSIEKSLEDSMKDFDWRFYVRYYSDLYTANITTEVDAIAHFVNSGYQEKRLGNIMDINFKRKLKNFDWRFYLKMNPDLVSAGVITAAQALDNYQYFGYQEGRWSSPKERPSLPACIRANAIVENKLDLYHICVSVKFESVACKKDDDLEALVVGNWTKTMYYITTTSNVAYAAEAFSKCREWVYVVKHNPLSKYLKSDIYSFLLRHVNAWIGFDYIMISSDRTVEMTSLTLKGMLSYARDEDFDCVPFFRSYATFSDQLKHRHDADAMAAWTMLLLKLGYSLEHIRMYDKARPFLRHTFLIKSNLLLKLTTSIQLAMNMTLSDPDLLKAFEGDSVDSSGFSPFYAIVFERLPAFFLSDMHAKVCSDYIEGPCTPNTEFYHFEDDRLVIRDKSEEAVRSHLKNDYILQLQ